MQNPAANTIYDDGAMGQPVCGRHLARLLKSPATHPDDRAFLAELKPSRRYDECACCAGFCESVNCAACGAHLELTCDYCGAIAGEDCNPDCASYFDTPQAEGGAR